MSAPHPTPPKGVFAAALTPLDENLAPDHGALVAHCRWLLANGCDGLAVLGTTGEANSFSVTERIALLEALVGAGVPGAALLPGTGCCAIPDTVTLSRAALDLGVAGVVTLPPFYYKGVSEDGLFAAYAEVIERVGDDRLRIYLYHFPRMSGVPLSLGLIERLRKTYPDAIAGIKDSSGDAANMEAMIRNFPGFRVFPGTEKLLLDMLRKGAAGCISATVNVTSPLAAEVYRKWDGPSAESLQGRLAAIRESIEAYPLIPALKAIMERHSGRAGWRHMRPPNMPLSESAKEALFAAIDATGVALANAA